MKKICKFVFFVILIFIFSSSNIFGAELPSVSFDGLNITSNCILLAEKETGNVLYEKNGYNKMYPASTTKILTAIVVLENSYLNERVKVNSSALSSIPSSYTTAELEVRRGISC